MIKTKTTLSIALGSIFVASMAASSIASAAQSPFAMTSLDKGYMVVAQADMAKDAKPAAKAKDAKPAAKAKDGKCGEGKCGGDKAKMTDAKPADAKAKDGKCGEGKCGGAKK